MLRDYRETNGALKKAPYRKANIRLVQHCAAISATAELLFQLGLYVFTVCVTVHLNSCQFWGDFCGSVSSLQLSSILAYV